MKKLFSALLLSLATLSLAACGDEEEIIMGFVPSQDSANIADTVEPLAERLSEELGVKVTGQVMTNYSALVEAMGNDQVDIGFLPPFGYALATDRYDNVEVVLASVRHGSTTYQAQYVVRADSGIETFADLEGKAWAFPDLSSASGYLFPAAQLMNELGVEDVDSWVSDMIQAGSHDNALMEVLEGGADFATTFDDARDSIAGDYPEVYDELVILGYTDDIPNDTISVNTNTLSSELIEQLVAVFMSFNDDEEMITIMDEVYNWTGIAEAQDSTYDVVRMTYESLGIEVE
ncbi:phosphate/phosphite/phosphonate ABC transporter substrate-binding protein [Evansella cellulosilytica]|uniref:Phosphonate ABC transporter, periplasmic phosphonate-binding protein n=1 Tax=Evansella cellulosilytica (strain ATCC 21833 / DSM 2522 / FERM P-1141 / JCM 9156 / N-4) TaxID=649639 RepID=E6TYR9_EVAC2|nr:phosphate/phosphite/phosphonate ABC transporter substrate-binding protein [Evansella cellulosilytica]ADU31254.1 phosphonate ABC transporter, periplasmic phosphonate-binding protein [Evansella cellulosilytica DSM 2522]